MSSHTLTAAENISFDIGRTSSISFCFICFTSNRHLRIIFHTAYLTAAIDVTIHRSIADADIRILDHGFLALECLITTLTGTEHIATNCTTSHVNEAIATTTKISLSAVSQRRICTYITNLTATIDVTLNICSTTDGYTCCFHKGNTSL